MGLILHLPPPLKVDTASPFPNMDVNPFGAELQGAMVGGSAWGRGQGAEPGVVCVYVHVCLCGGAVRVRTMYVLFSLQFEEVYKSALGCFVNGAERLVSEHGDLADHYLRKASVLSAVRMLADGW